MLRTHVGRDATRGHLRTCSRLSSAPSATSRYLTRATILCNPQEPVPLILFHFRDFLHALFSTLSLFSETILSFTMFSYSFKNAVVLGLAFLASGALGAPVSEEAALERRAVANPCSSTIARTGAVSFCLPMPHYSCLIFISECCWCRLGMLRRALRPHLHWWQSWCPWKRQWCSPGLWRARVCTSEGWTHQRRNPCYECSSDCRHSYLLSRTCTDMLIRVPPRRCGLTMVSGR